MRIYVVRHGLSEANVQGLVSGQAGTNPLTPAGFDQAQATALLLPSSIRAIHSSNLLRTRQTAETINERFDVGIEYHSELRERNFGSIAGNSWDEIERQIGLGARDKDVRQEYDYSPYGGESAKDVWARVQSFLANLKGRYGDGEVLIVTHAGIIRLLYLAHENQIVERIGNASIHEFDV